MSDPLTVACQHLAGSQEIIERKDAEIKRLRGDLEVMRLQRDAARKELAKLAESEQQDSAAMSHAPTGSVEPVAWAAFLGGELEVAFRSQADAFMWAYKRDGVEIVPLYRTLTLTDEEREAVALMAGTASDPRGVAVYRGHEIAATLRGLLERLK